jgi:hypothetical protein
MKCKNKKKNITEDSVDRKDNNNKPSRDQNDPQN